MFNEALGLVEIRQHDGDSVLNSLQRIIYHYYRSFDHWVYISDHLHSAFDDVMAELIITLHDVFMMDVRKWLITVDEFIPSFGTGKYKAQHVDSICEQDPEYVIWFIFTKDTKCENYLRRYMINNWEPPSIPPIDKLSQFGRKITEQ